MNKKYLLNIKDDKIENLNLYWKKIKDEGLNDLCKIEFKELKELNLQWNHIVKIDIIQRLNLGTIKNVKFKL